MASAALKKIGLALALVLGCGGLIGWLASRPNTEPQANVVIPEPVESAAAPLQKSAQG